MKKILPFLGALLFCSAGHSAIELGFGFNSATSGRIVPAVVTSLSGEGWLLTGHSTGVQTDLYYHSSYGLSYFWTWDSGTLFSGNVSSGLGLGAFYSVREYRDSSSADVEQGSDFGLGPGFRVNWTFLGPLFLNMEGVFGLREITHHLTLNYQDYVNFSIGLRF